MSSQAAQNFQASESSSDQIRVKNLVNKFDNQGGTNSELQQSSQFKVETLNSGLTTGVSAVVDQSEVIDFESAEAHEQRARELREKALSTLKTNEEEFSQAEMAQNAARIAAEQANAKTQQALEHQERGQQLLAEAGARLIEAGAKLQQEATSIKREVPFNVHQQAEVRQTTCVAAAGAIAAEQAHQAATFREVIPPPVVPQI